MSEEAPDQDTPPEGTEQVAGIVQGGAEELSKLGAVLTAAAIPHDIIEHPDCASGGCGPQLVLVTPVDQVEAAREAIEAHWNGELPDDERFAAEAVVDLDADEATCPACMTPFPTSDTSRCPECGLNFG